MAPKELKKLTLVSEADLDSVLEAVLSESNENLLDFITKLDDLKGDWDFTEALYAHFKKMHEEFTIIEAEEKQYQKRRDGHGTTN